LENSSPDQDATRRSFGALSGIGWQSVVVSLYLVNNYQPTAHQTLRWKPEIWHFTRYSSASPVSDILS